MPRFSLWIVPLVFFGVSLGSARSADLDDATFLRIALYGSIAELQQAIESGANLSAIDRNGNTTLHHAARRGFQDAASEAIQLLIEAGADVNAPDLGGTTPLHIAAWRGYSPESARVLLNAGADVHARGIMDWTPLHVAVQNVSPRMLETVPAMLLDVGADASAKDSQGKTAIEYVQSEMLRMEAYRFLEAATLRGSKTLASRPSTELKPPLASHGDSRIEDLLSASQATDPTPATTLLSDADQQLANLASAGLLTVRALRAWGRLPDQFSQLVLSLHAHDIDLLGANQAAIDVLAHRAAESPHLSRYIDDLMELSQLLASYVEQIADTDAVRNEDLVRYPINQWKCLDPAMIEESSAAESGSALLVDSITEQWSGGEFTVEYFFSGVSPYGPDPDHLEDSDNRWKLSVKNDGYMNYDQQMDLTPMRHGQFFGPMARLYSCISVTIHNQDTVWLQLNQAVGVAGSSVHNYEIWEPGFGEVRGPKTEAFLITNGLYIPDYQIDPAFLSAATPEKEMPPDNVVTFKLHVKLDRFEGSGLDRRFFYYDVSARGAFRIELVEEDIAP